jgi:fermentation-respiration switch protein FrsA (DUF1100 family)
VRLAAALGLTYLGVIIVLLVLENRMVYPATPAAERWEPPPSPLIEDVELPLADGTRVHGWWLPRPGGDGALLYLHGNGGNLSQRGPLLVEAGARLNVSVLIVDYPGYGKSTGHPSEEGCYAAADAAYRWLTAEGKAKVPAERVIVFGVSLGGGVAVDLASRQPHRALVLANTFTSLPDVGQNLYPWLPVRWLMHNQFNSLRKIGDCHRPVFISHGDRDTFIPTSQGEKLFAAANEPKTFLAVEGADHNTALTPVFYAKLRQFLDKAAP